MTDAERIAALEARLAGVEGRLAGAEAQVTALRAQLATPPDVVDASAIPDALARAIANECRGMSGDVFRQTKRAVIQRFMETGGEEAQRVSAALTYLREGEQVTALLD